MNKKNEDAQWCREHASQLRSWVDRQSDPVIRQAMLDLADGWELMARSYELRAMSYQLRSGRVERSRRGSHPTADVQPDQS